jgi:non-ribosomal peptide synthetase component E (peptide arylation enzyme)
MMLGPESELTMSLAASPQDRDRYDAQHLARNAANFAPLSPVRFLARAAAVYPDKLAIVHDTTRLSYRRFYDVLASLPTPCAGAG